jgi:hypothetical protein
MGKESMTRPTWRLPLLDHSRSVARHLQFGWSAFLIAAWVVMFALAANYMGRNARNLPMQDEWEFISPILGDTSGWEWAFEKHYEHRLILGRLLYIALHRVTGIWFPAGMILTLLVFAASAAILMRTARRLRGASHPADVWFAVLLLSAGHYESLLMGYQITFTLTTVFAALLLAVMAGSDRVDPIRSAGRAGLLLLGIMMGGGLGLLFVPSVAVWIGYQLVRAWRDGVARTRCAIAALPLALAVAYCGWAVVGVLRSPPSTAPNTLGVTLECAGQFLTEGIGPFGSYHWPVLGVVVLAIESVTAFSLLVVFVRRPSERPVALGWLAVLAAVALNALAVGHARPSGFASRYACISCLGLCVALLAAARYVRLPRPVGVPLALALLLVAVPLCRGNGRIAEMHAWYYRMRYAALEKDIHAGVPIEFVADRNVLFPVPACRGGFTLLHEHDFGPLRGIANMPPLDSERIALPPGTRIPAWNTVAEPTPPRLALPNIAGSVAAIRVHFHCSDSRYWQHFNLKWVSDSTGEVRESNVYPWLVPGDATTSFWVNDRICAAWIEPGCATTGLELTAVEVFRRAANLP